MQAIDTHCHITHTIKQGLKLNVLIQHAQVNNVIAIIDSPVSINDYMLSIRYHRSNPKKIFITLGASPAGYHEMNIGELISNIRTFAEKKEIVGIGEVGLDYYWVKDYSIRKKQHEIFRQFIELANELQLPLTIHSRDAEEEAVKELNIAETPVIMHSFGGDIDTALDCIDRGYYISIPTCVVDRRKHKRLAKNIPLEFLITETDSPYLSPFPDKKRNEPANVIYAVKEIAKIKEIPESEVSKITVNNAKKIFKLKL
ncbi:MAG: TatD family hydrolase [Candidatus Heimdallarchaeota archaeon]|nr:TatD family hydrolase [Candidatus Heimdallarchaeota archaeon]